MKTLLFITMILCLTILFASHIENKSSLFLNIGPHKTGTTSIEAFFIHDEVYKQSRLANYFWPSCVSDCEQMQHQSIVSNKSAYIDTVANPNKHNHLLYGLDIMNFIANFRNPMIRQKDTNAKYIIEFLSECHRKLHNVILVSDGFCELSLDGIKKLKTFLDNFNINIIVTYREWLSLVVSEYNQIQYMFDPLIDIDYPFNLSNLKVTIKKAHIRGFKYFLDYNNRYRMNLNRDLISIINRYQQVFPEIPMKIIDYDGLLYTKQDLVFVHSCEMMSLFCDNTKLFHDIPHYVNTRHNMTEREILNTLLVYGEIQKKLIYKDSLLRLLHMKYLWPPIPYTNYINEVYRNMSLDYDLEFRKRYDRLMFYSNRQLIISKVMNYSMISIDVDAILEDTSWIAMFESILALET